MKFQDIIGYAATKQHLINTVKQNQVAHAQLFAGKEGCANLNLALAYATYLNCENPEDLDACGSCPSCAKSDKYIHPDIHFVFPVAGTKTITGTDVVSKNYLKYWRKFLNSTNYHSLNSWSEAFGGENKQANISKQESREIITNLSLKAFEGKFKITVIWLPELMHISAANGILKILEEPQEGTVFLLVTNNRERLLSTIVSRTQVVSIGNYADDEIKSILVNEFQTEETKAGQLAHLADGNVHSAIELLEEVEDDSHIMFRDWMRLCFQNDYATLVARSEEFSKLNKIAQRSLLQYGINILRETLVAGYDDDRLIRVAGEELKFVLNFKKVMSPKLLESITSQLADAIYHLERNASPKIMFMDLSLSIAYQIKNI